MDFYFNYFKNTKFLSACSIKENIFETLIGEPE